MSTFMFLVSLRLVHTEDGATEADERESGGNLRSRWQKQAENKAANRITRGPICSTRRRSLLCRSQSEHHAAVALV